MSKTINISDNAYNTLKELAAKEFRPLTKQFDMVLDKYVSGETDDASDIDIPLPPLEMPEPNPVVKKEPWNNDQEYIELEEELKDLNEELEANEDDENATNDILREMKEIQDKMGEIRKKY